MVQFPTLSSASINRLSAQHAANPQRTSTSGKAIMLGKEPERQQEIDAVCAIIRNCARVGIPAAKYNMNLLGVLRTPDTPGRGGSLYSTWECGTRRKIRRDGGRLVSADTSWERITYFLDRVIPVATSTRSVSPATRTTPACRRKVSAGSTAFWELSTA